MAITDAGKLFESEATSRAISLALGQTVKAGSLLLMALGGQRSGADLDVASITDTKGNAWDWKTLPSSYRMAGVAWCRTPVAMTTSDRVTVTWNGTPSYCWKSCHAFEGAAGTPTDEETRSGYATSASVTLNVTGSDWLTFASLTFPYDYGVSSTPLNSSTSQDDNGNTTAAPWCECVSRNGTTGSTHTIGLGSLATSLTYAMVGVSFPYEALTAPPVPKTGTAFLIGV